MLSKEKRKEIKYEIQKLEESLAKLREALDKDNEERQHEAIDHLEDYLKEADNNFLNLKNFLNLVIKEFKHLIVKK